jgi:hypothetical protein
MANPPSEPADGANSAAASVKPARKKPGAKPGQRFGGRAKGTKNKRTLERERLAALGIERAHILEEARAAGASIEVAEAKATGRKLMKDIAFEFAAMFAGIAAYHQPILQQAKNRDGSLAFDKNGRPVMEMGNPNYDEAKFLKYGQLATQVALGAAAYESPKLAAVLVQAGMVSEISVTGGLPDEEDGGFYPSADAPAAEEAEVVPVQIPKVVND